MIEIDLNKVFLGGTVGNSLWRNEMKELLNAQRLSWFDPTVSTWYDISPDEEKIEKLICGYHLYVITPKMADMSMVAEVVDGSNKRPGRTIMVILYKDGDKCFSYSRIRSLYAVADIIERNGAAVFYNLEDAANFMGYHAD